ncbi:MAG: hypothetical protein ACMUIU_05005 [bacterium]
MDRKHIYLLILTLLILCAFFAFPPLTGESASVKTTLDAKYTFRDSTEMGSRDKDHEYNPRLSVKYSNQLTRWTNLTGEAKFDYKREDKSREEDTETREPQIELMLKSLIYDFKTGFKETWNINRPTEQRAFGHLLIQPSELPELQVDYDHDETKNQLKKNKITLGAQYKPSKTLRIKLDFKHEYTDYIDQDQPDIDDINMNGEVKFNHTLSTRAPTKVEISYKVETLYQETLYQKQRDTNSPVSQDELLQTLRGKLSYKPTQKTNISLEYENKTKSDRRATGEDKSHQDMQFDVRQDLTDWLEVRGWIRRESEEEQDIDSNNKITYTDTEKRTINGYIRAVPKKWMQLNVKVINEESIEEPKGSDPGEKIDKTTLEASLRSDFPNLLRSHQSLDFKRVNENKHEKPFSEEERLMWKWSFSPVENLTLRPEYIRSVTNKKDTSDITYDGPSKDVTNEYRLNFDYSLSLHDIWTVDFSHDTSRKEVETRFTDKDIPSKNRTEINNDSSLELDFQPYESLFITSQVTRRYYKISGDNPSKSEEMSYSFKFDWSFSPFTWSTSYKYDDKKEQNDTETFESKILYDFSDYTLEVEYKFTQTFRAPKDMEDIITLRFKAVF